VQCAHSAFAAWLVTATLALRALGAGLSFVDGPLVVWGMFCARLPRRQKAQRSAASQRASSGAAVSWRPSQPRAPRLPLVAADATARVAPSPSRTG
jgi:hypothetical protein